MATFHDLDDATMDEVGRGQRFNALALEFDRAFGHFATLTVQQVADCAQRRRLAGTIAAQERNDAAFGYGEGDALEDEDHVVVNNLDVIHTEEDIRGGGHV